MERCVILESPDWSELDTIWKNPLPFILWPVCGKPVLAHWLEKTLHDEAGTVLVRTDDRPHLVRAWLDKGNYWSKKIEVIPSSVHRESEAVFRMEGLPGEEPLGPVTDGRELLQRWYELHEAASRQRHATGLHIDSEILPGVWAAPGSVIDPSARLTAPCWIGPKSRIGPRCVIGPGAYVGARAVLDEDVELVRGIVCADTFAGKHTRIHCAAAQGGLFLDWERGVAVRIAEDFILADLEHHPARPGALERAAAAILRLAVWPLARLWNVGAPATVRNVMLGTGESLSLKTWTRGPLLLRREAWLGAVAAGSFRLLGILPRSEADWEALPMDLRALLEREPVGVLSLADLYDCHDPGEPDEWMHAAYQAGEEVGYRQLMKSAFHIALKQPLLP